MQGSNSDVHDAFMDWEVLRILETIAADLGSSPSRSVLAESKDKRGRAYLFPKSIDKFETVTYEAWNDNLWKSLDAQGAKESMLRKMLTPFKIAYYQSQVLLEDHFMDQGLKAKEARPLALYVLNTVVAPYL